MAKFWPASTNAALSLKISMVKFTPEQLLCLSTKMVLIFANELLRYAPASKRKYLSYQRVDSVVQRPSSTFSRRLRAKSLKYTA